MVVRILQLINNFVKDIGKTNTKPWAEYCVLGHFDAMHVCKKEDIGNNMQIWKTASQATISSMAGVTNCKNIVLITGDEHKDEMFWKQCPPNDDCIIRPLLFVSLVRIGYQPTEKTIQGIIETINQKEHMIAYLTYNYSDIIVLHTHKTYKKGIESVKNLRELANSSNLYTILAIWENYLEDWPLFSEEINCRISASIKPGANKDDFVGELKMNLPEAHITDHYVLGDWDIEIEIQNVAIGELLKLYKMGNLLTHGHSLFTEVFYNAKTEFFVPD